MGNKQVTEILDQAMLYVGIKESPSGSNNVQFNTRYYGRKVSGSAYPWCMAFIWCLFQDIGAGGLFYDGGKTASCGTLMNWAKRKGLFVSGDYKPGDVLFFDFTGKKGAPTHTGIVDLAHNNGTVIAIEGNTSIGNDSNGGEVMRRNRDTKCITGAFRPLYEEDTMTYEDFKAFMKQYEAEKASESASNWPKQQDGKTELEKAIDAGISSGNNPKAYLSREEGMIMAYRASIK